MRHLILASSCFAGHAVEYSRNPSRVLRLSPFSRLLVQENDSSVFGGVWSGGSCISWLDRVSRPREVLQLVERSYQNIAATYASLEALSNIFGLIEITVKDRKSSPAVVDQVTESIEVCETGVNELNKRLVKVLRKPVKDIEEQI